MGRIRPIRSAANDQLLQAMSIGRLIIAYRNGAPVHLSDVATVIDNVEKSNRRHG